MSLLLAAWLSAPAHAGMTQVLLASGPYSLSIDGAGSSVSSSMTYQITRPKAGATVYQAFASVSGVWGSGDPGVNSLTIGGIGVTLNQVQVDPGNAVYTRFDDVTAELSAYLDALPVGVSNVPVIEGGGAGQNDGNSLVVVWQDPVLPISAVSLSYGSLLTGTNPRLSINTAPMDTLAAGFGVEVGIGIAFSTGISPQVSSVLVNGNFVNGSAGGYDDGNLANGGLYTFGGDGDGANSERYDATTMVSDGDTQVALDLIGQSQDDMAIGMWVWVVGARLQCGPTEPDADGDTVADACDLCPGGDDLLDGDGDLVPDDCDICLLGPDGQDGDDDGVPDACDQCPGGHDVFDADGDTVPDGCDVCDLGDDRLDGDGDGFPDACDRCSLGDDRADADGDGVADACDQCPGGNDLADADGDGAPDACDLCAGGDDAVDTDGDGLPNACDPTLLYLSPKRGPLGGGNPTTVIGQDLDPLCVVSIDGAAVRTTVIDPFTMEIVPSAHAAGMVDVSMVCGRGGDTLIGGYTYYDESEDPGVPPDVRSVLPNQVKVEGGDVVTVSGTGFSPGVEVVIADGGPADATFVDDTEITVVVPAHPEGMAAIEVTNPDGQSDRLEGALIYLAEPDLTGEPIVQDDDATKPPPDSGGCATAPGAPIGGLGVVLVGLLTARRRRLAVGGAVVSAAISGCSEYDVHGDANPGTGAFDVAPVAVTGPAVETTRDQPVMLDGTASYDPDDPAATLSYTWVVAISPDGADVTLDTATDPLPGFGANVLGAYVVGLEVVDAEGVASKNPAAQVVEIVPWRELVVTMTWSQPVDVDLHVVAPGAAYASDGDCFFGNPAPSWGDPANGEDDPTLSTDDDGSGSATARTESVTLTAPAEGGYTLIATYWNDRGTGDSAVGSLEVSAAGRSIATSQVTLDQVGDALIAGVIDWTTLGWAADGTVTTHEALGGAPFNE